MFLLFLAARKTSLGRRWGQNRDFVQWRSHASMDDNVLTSNHGVELYSSTTAVVLFVVLLVRASFVYYDMDGCPTLRSLQLLIVQQTVVHEVQTPAGIFSKMLTPNWIDRGDIVVCGSSNIPSSSIRIAAILLGSTIIVED